MKDIRVRAHRMLTEDVLYLTPPGVPQQCQVRYTTTVLSGCHHRSGPQFVVPAV